MKKKLLSITVLFMACIMGATILFFINTDDSASDTHSREQIVALNEVEQLASKASANTSKGNNELHTAISNLQQDIRDNSGDSHIKQEKYLILTFGLLCTFFLFLILGYIYRSILRPFDQMKDYAKEIARGNLDIPLNYARGNYFGAYTWAFDHMRKEIIKARSCEKEAILNNKTVIATLSHDIKTPIASIRAYAEGLDANMDTDLEKRRRYTSTIMRKCDEVTKLTNDLFLHSLSDLDKLKMEFAQVEMQHFLIDICDNKEGFQPSLTLRHPLPAKTLYIDVKRLEQAIENLLNNSKKYANTDILLSAEIKDQLYCIHIRDYGPGIPNEDMPFIMEKFYRGHNAGQQEGSGLGLFIVNYIMKQHGGSLKLYNHPDGLEAILELPFEKEASNS